MEIDREPINPRLWNEVDGDNTLALDWPIDQSSVVWEIGGYRGRWAGQMVEKFDPYMYIFEPQLWAHRVLQDKFENNPKVNLYPFGLWTHDVRLLIWEYDTDGASVVKQDGREKDWGEFKDVYGCSRSSLVDVCLMNIEGGEFVLLPYMIGLGLMNRVNFFWCQFHPVEVEHGEEKTKLIFQGLEGTHKILWDYYPTAVAWERK